MAVMAHERAARALRDGSTPARKAVVEDEDHAFFQPRRELAHPGLRDEADSLS
jgi:hypothetical protein